MTVAGATTQNFSITVCNCNSVDSVKIGGVLSNFKQAIEQLDREGSRSLRKSKSVSLCFALG